jgi:2-methylcitrate dehydratase PrpD
MIPSKAGAPHLARLGAWAAAQSADRQPALVRRAARYQLLDMVAATQAAARSPEVTAVVDAVSGFAGGGRSTVLAGGHTLPPGEAALANAVCSMAQDFDDIVWMGHTCHSAVFAALAVAEHEARSGAELVTAIVVANEIAGRIGASTILGPLNGQMWTFIHLVGAAAAAAKLLGLDGERTTHALAIALAQPNFALQPGFLAPTSKLLAAATPTQAGLQAAYFARAGMTGAPDLLEDSRGFWRRFAFLPLPTMLDGLGEFWALSTLTMKTFPGCHYFQTACTALEQIRARSGPLALADVRRVRVDTTKLGAEATRFAHEYAPLADAVTAVNANFDLATTVAIWLHAGRLTADELRPAWLAEHSAAILAWRERVEVHHDPALTAAVLASARAIPGGRSALARVRLRDLPTLARRYREEYRSTLFSADELRRWLGVAARRLVRRGRLPPPATPDGAVPLPFPSRVIIERVDGGVEEARVDLPVGSLAAAGVERELQAKLRNAGGWGDAEARALLDSGLTIEERPLAESVRRFALRRR